jgi:hypothetical protein
MTWYVSGPMTGYDDLNFPAFSYATTTLRSRGMAIVSPHENDIDGGEWDDYLRHDLRLLSECHGIVLLAGWSKSKGAQLELFVALRLGLAVRFFDDETSELVNVE